MTVCTICSIHVFINITNIIIIYNKAAILYEFTQQAVRLAL